MLINTIFLLVKRQVRKKWNAAVSDAAIKLPFEEDFRCETAGYRFGCRIWFPRGAASAACGKSVLQAESRWPISLK
ncbi:hypothetical protein NBH20_12375 [Rhizobium sp. S153]|uniref:Uncharacterized protein n=1 Tax=Ciceribacter sichuanensis TaxID=2949647 RepID=A0ABT0V817_9HYPH|nr:hypothetical protein [Ciceribacter sp. S153]MCM2401956.1 hypothetical protein [Ciceribacter sp. S153]